MRDIKKIIIHCSATPEGKEITVTDIDQWHRKRGFWMIGYHYVIYADGSTHACRKENVTGAHCLGSNFNSIGNCYIGGMTADGKQAKDTRTEEQKKALRELIRKLLRKYPQATIYGHRDLSRDINQDGRIEKWEWMKECPCFDCIPEYFDLMEEQRKINKAEREKQEREAGATDGAGRPEQPEPPKGGGGAEA